MGTKQAASATAASNAEIAAGMKNDLVGTAKFANAGEVEAAKDGAAPVQFSVRRPVKKWVVVSRVSRPHQFACELKLANFKWVVRPVLIQQQTDL